MARPVELIELRFVIPEAATECVVETMEAAFGVAVVQFTNPRKQTSRCSIYFPRKAALPDLSQVRLILNQAAKQTGIPFKALPKFQPVRAEDWAESWKKHFKPIRIKQQLLIKPSWSKLKPIPGEAMVVLDPGLSFGTGNHATTSYCLNELVRLRRENKQSVLDIGSGSGILAISAAKLGYHSVRAFDNDPEAVRIARGNARTNKVHVKFTVECLEGFKSKAKFDIVLGNLIDDVLRAHAGTIVALSKAGGRLVLAGILRGQFAAVRNVYEKLGCKLLKEVTEKEWRSGTFLVP